MRTRNAARNTRRPGFDPRTLLIAAALVCLAGCSSVLEIELDPAVAPPAPDDRVALPVGVYYAPEFRDYTYETANTPRLGVHTLPLGKARVARAGQDVSIVTYGLGVAWALEEAGYQASERGVSVITSSNVGQTAASKM